MRFSAPTLTLLLVAGFTTTACSTTTPPTPAAQPAAAEEKPVSPASAANMASNCFACHGPNGVSPGTIPSLHTLTAGNITDMLKAFKNGERPSTVMGRHAKGYTNTEIGAISNYIAGLNKK
jgi:sulfide dehydrogenase cytochrome subunit